MMLAIRRVFSNGHEEKKCPVEEAVAELVREADELRQAIRSKRKAKNGDAEAR